MPWNIISWPSHRLGYKRATGQGFITIDVDSLGNLGEIVVVKSFSPLP